MQLNEAQQEAVSYVQGPCLVLAGAGSGKTRVITAKITALIRRHALRPESICAVTFTNKAAAEMRERVAADLGSDTAKSITISTFHSLGLNIIRRDHNTFGLGRNFSLFDQYDQKKILGDIIKENFPQLLTEFSEKTLAEQASARISLWKSSLVPPQEVDNQTLWTAVVYDQYTQYLKACNAVDFDDLIFMVTKQLQSNEVFREKWQEMFDYILVDEYQDTNENQYQLLKSLTAKKCRFTVVGDDDQSIYSWRGARPENIRTLASDFPDLKVIKLEENYRSTGHILHCANGLISHNQHMFSKTLRAHSGDGAKIQVIEVATEKDESDRVAELIFRHKYHHKTSFKDYAVLYRSNFQSRSLEQSFRENHIPCVITGGSSFFEQPEIKDLMAWCRVICNPKDDAALLRIINVPRRGIGAESIAILSKAAKLGGKALYDSMLNSAIIKQLNTKQMQAVAGFVILLTNLRQMLIAKKDEALAKSLLDHLNYENYLKATNENPVAADIRIKNSRSFMQWIADLIVGKRDQDPLNFLEAVDKLGLREMLDRSSNDPQDADAVQLMTFHAAKGLEFPYVFMIGIEEGILPHRNSIDTGEGIDEERRLCYVGITRARQELTMLLCRQRRVHNTQEQELEVKFNSPSRFLQEMPKEDLEWYGIGATPSETKIYQLEAIDRALAKLSILSGGDPSSK